MAKAIDPTTLPIYNKARKNFIETHNRQIVKGYIKYGEPLNPTAWTVKQLVKHAREELADAFNYLEAIEAKVPANETPQIELLYRDIQILREERNEWKRKAERLERLLQSMAN